MHVCMRKVFHLFTFYHVHLLFIAFTILLQDVLDLRYGNYREELREQEVAGKEQAKRSQIKANLPNSRCIIGTPGRRQVITVQGSNDDHETLEPHTNVYNDRHKEGYQQVAAHLA